jgi:hypothetical protein
MQFSDIAPNFARTGCDGYLSAEALLWDPRLFANVPDYVMSGRGHTASKQQRLAAAATAKEYLSLVMGRYPTPAAFAKAHLFKLLHHSLEVHTEMRDALARSTTDNGDRAALDDMLRIVTTIEKLERECDVDVYVKRTRSGEAADGDAEGGCGAAGAALAPCAPGCRRQAADADYASAVDDALGGLFERAAAE